MVRRGTTAVAGLALCGALGTWGCGLVAEDARRDAANGGTGAGQPVAAGTSGSASGAAASPSGGSGAGGRGGDGGRGGEIVLQTPDVDECPPIAGAPPVDPVPEPHAGVPCEDPQASPYGAGFETCKNGTTHRSAPSTCVSPVPRDEPASGIVYDECVFDRDCVEKPSGYCVIGACYYGCLNDAECGEGMLCECGELVGECRPSGCRSDADCPAGYPCTGTTFSAFGCQTPYDSCLTDADCAPFDRKAVCGGDGSRRLCVIPEEVCPPLPRPG